MDKSYPVLHILPKGRQGTLRTAHAYQVRAYFLRPHLHFSGSFIFFSKKYVARAANIKISKAKRTASCIEGSVSEKKFVENPDSRMTTTSSNVQSHPSQLIGKKPYP